MTAAPAPAHARSAMRPVQGRPINSDILADPYTEMRYRSRLLIVDQAGGLRTLWIT